MMPLMRLDRVFALLTGDALETKGFGRFICLIATMPTSYLEYDRPSSQRMVQKTTSGGAEGSLLGLLSRESGRGALVVPGVSLKLEDPAASSLHPLSLTKMARNILGQVSQDVPVVESLDGSSAFENLNTNADADDNCSNSSGSSNSCGGGGEETETVVASMVLDTLGAHLPSKKDPLTGEVRFRHDTAYVSNLAVTSQGRRLGIGSLMMDEAEAVAREWGCRSIALHCDPENHAARSLYFGRGYRDGSAKPTRETYGFGEPRFLQIMIKRLSGGESPFYNKQHHDELFQEQQEQEQERAAKQNILTTAVASAGGGGERLPVSHLVCPSSGLA